MSRGYVRRFVRALLAHPTLEIHIPISPTQTFFNQVRCLTLSLRRFGGAYRSAPVILSIGDKAIDPAIVERQGWLRPLGVEAHWIPPEDFRAHSYFATGNARFLHEYRSDVVLFLDADILIARSFEPLVRDVYLKQVIAGMIAPVSPLQFIKQPTTWDDLYKRCGIDQPAVASEEHTAWPYAHSSAEDYRHCPPYFNYGVVCAPASVMKQIATFYFEDLLKLRAAVATDLVAQVALTTAIIKSGVKWKSLPVRYNFPNHPMMEALHGGEIPHATFLHLKEDHQFHRAHLFSDLAHVHAAVARQDFRGVNKIARGVLRAIEPGLVDEA